MRWKNGWKWTVTSTAVAFSPRPPSLYCNCVALWHGKIKFKMLPRPPFTRSHMVSRKSAVMNTWATQFYAGGCHCFGGRACVGRCCWSCSAVDSSISKQGWTLCVVGSFVALVPLPSIYTHLVVVYLGTAKGYVKICRSISMSLRPKYHNCMISSTYNTNNWV